MLTVKAYKLRYETKKRNGYKNQTTHRITRITILNKEGFKVYVEFEEVNDN